MLPNLAPEFGPKCAESGVESGPALQSGTDSKKSFPEMPVYHAKRVFSHFRIDILAAAVSAVCRFFSLILFFVPGL